MSPLLELLQKDSRLSAPQLAEQLALSEEEVRRQIAAFEADGTIMGYQAVLDSERASSDVVTALIEVRLTPERGGGFDRLAERIAKFEQVTNCWLISGGYDLAVMVQGTNLQEVARFVAEKLSTLGGVLSTATHFKLKTYKQNGFLSAPPAAESRLPVSP